MIKPGVVGDHDSAGKSLGERARYFEEARGVGQFIRRGTWQCARCPVSRIHKRAPRRDAARVECYDPDVYDPVGGRINTRCLNIHECQAIRQGFQARSHHAML